MSASSTMWALKLLFLALLGACLLPSTAVGSGGAKMDKSASSSLSQEDNDNVERAFLGMMGLASRPKPPAGPVYVPQKMKELYEEMNNLQPGSFDSHARKKNSRSTSSSSVFLPGNTIRSFYFEDHDDTDTNSDSTRERQFHFNVDALPSEETLHRAVLHVSRDVPINSTSHQLSVYQKLSKQHEVLVDTKRVLPGASHVDGSKWHTFDVTNAVQQWRHEPHKNHGLRVKVQGGSDRHGTRLRRSAGTSPEQWQEEQPYLVTYTDDRDAATQAQDKKHALESSRSRRRRQSRTRRDKKKNRKRRKRICRRLSLVVDFEEVGWNSWIVAPANYDAYYCHGECPFALSDNLNTTNHAVVQSLVHSMNPELVPKPCCVPTELSPFSLLYVNTNGTLVLKAYKDMVVEACGCR